MLALEIKDKDVALSSAHTTLSKTATTLIEATQELGSSHKRVKELEMSLNEARESWNNRLKKQTYPRSIPS